MTPPRVLALVLVAGSSCLSRDTVATFEAANAAASAVFEHGVCKCGGESFSTNMSIDGFDSRVAPWAPDAGRGDLATNSTLTFSHALNVNGDVIVAGNVDVGQTLTVGRDLLVQGGLGGSGAEVRVEGAASIGGNVFLRTLEVAGALTTPSSSSVSGSVHSGSRQMSQVSVPPPCRCDADAGIDVAALVELHGHTNGDATIGVQPNTGPTTIELPCGESFIDLVTGMGPLTLHATKPAAVFLRGSKAPLVLTLGPGAELDLFVDGPLHFAPGPFGDPARPSAVRLYSVNADSPIDLTGVTPFSALFYAPDSNITSASAGEFFGALVVQNVLGGWGDSLTLHYDQAATSSSKASCP